MVTITLYCCLWLAVILHAIPTLLVATTATSNLNVWFILLYCFLCRDYDGKVTPEEVAAAAMYLKDTLGKEGVQELISNLSKDGGQPIIPTPSFSICC